VFEAYCAAPVAEALAERVAVGFAALSGRLSVVGVVAPVVFDYAELVDLRAAGADYVAPVDWSAAVSDYDEPAGRFVAEGDCELPFRVVGGQAVMPL